MQEKVKFKIEKQALKIHHKMHLHLRVSSNRKNIDFHKYFCDN